ncbi:MAG: HlyD family efflux transporter periplasmic adaptor subunit [Opitutaceae bacterium]|nr:HlyD family efflux transporter periplasmic adaptor subunit [Opitutaceae bacterium]
MSAVRFHNVEDVRDSIETLAQEHGVGHPFIYWTFLAVIIAAIVCLPLVKVDMSIGAPGQVRPAVERMPVRTAISGKITVLNVSDNQSVRKGDTLLEVETASLDVRIAQVTKQVEENSLALADLVLLTQSVSFEPTSDALSNCKDISLTDSAKVLTEKLVSAQYIRQYSLLQSEYRRLLARRARKAVDLTRSEILHKKGLITDSAYEDQRFEVDAIGRELELTLQQTLSRWQADRVERERRETDLASELKQLKEQRDLYLVRAPIDGTAIGFRGLHEGLFLPAEQQVGEISPGGGLQTDVFVSTRDVGFIHKNQSVNIQVEAFPYTEWGMLKGRVKDISQDFIQLGQQAAFRVVVDLDSTQLRSSSGVIVDVRRGMTVNARFVLERRTLFSILYGKLSESLDPRAERAAN